VIMLSHILWPKNGLCRQPLIHTMQIKGKPLLSTA